MNTGTKTILILLILFFSCENSKEEKSTTNELKEDLKEIPFSSKMWKEKIEDTYPHRAKMYREVLYGESVRTLSKQEVLSMLGKPDKEENNHCYYLIDRTGIGSWTLNQKSMVIKFKADDSVEWIKMYE
ncbi:hypothetical protein [Ekhidna sp.]|uniref:hypothetical protein n=1 Tax=Ekhidna sp. TaxID=2608089 RepID=UPI003BAD29F9